MSATTRWLDNKTETLNEAIDQICSCVNEDIESDTATRYTNWRINKVFENNIYFEFNDRSIEFNFIRFNVEIISPGDQPLVDRTKAIEGFIIAYDNQGVNYIINRNSGSMTLLRKMLNYNAKNEITRNMIKIESDAFFWLISRVYNGENIIEEINNIPVIIETVRGFRGETDDSLSKVSANGETVMNIISTLSFFLESKNINQIKVDINFNNHNTIDLTLNTNSTVKTNILNYIGPFNIDNNSDLLISKLYLLIYLELIPTLNNAYLIAIENEEWNQNIKIDFLKNVAEELNNRVEEKIHNLEN